MVEDRFNDIGAAITNSGGEIELDLMRKRKSAIPNEAGSSQALLLPPDTSFNGNLDGKSPPWPTDNVEEEISDVEDLRSHSSPLQVPPFPQTKNQHTALVFLSF